MEMKPIAFAEYEGGRLREWPYGAVTESMLKAAMSFENWNYGPLATRVHALHFADGRQWDIKNGWRGEKVETETSKAEDTAALRDEFAKIALGAVISMNPRMSVPPTAENWRTLTRNCYTIADLMIEARSRK